MNGIHFYQKYKEEIAKQSKKEAPVIVLSGISKRNIVEILVRMGAQNYIVKPFDFKTIQQKISTLLSDQELS